MNLKEKSLSILTEKFGLSTEDALSHIRQAAQAEIDRQIALELSRLMLNTELKQLESVFHEDSAPMMADTLTSIELKTPEASPKKVKKTKANKTKGKKRKA